MTEETLNGGVQSVSQPQTPNTDDYVSKDLVNNLVRESKDKGYQKGYEAARNEFLQSQQKGEQNTVHKQPELTQDEIRRLMQEELNRQEADRLKKQQSEQKEREEQELQQSIYQLQTQLAKKCEDAAKRYNDFDNVVNQVDFSEMPQVLVYANEAENAGDVLYHLAQDPTKISMILASTPSIAKSHIKKISESIKRNDAAKDTPKSGVPIDRMSPSNVGGVDRELSREDRLHNLKNRYRW